MKQAIKEAALNNYKELYEGEPLTHEVPIDAFIKGAKWMKDRSYSEEDIINALHSVELKDNKDYSKIYNGMKDWFEQFKKQKNGQ